MFTIVWRPVDLSISAFGDAVLLKGQMVDGEVNETYIIVTINSLRSLLYKGSTGKQGGFVEHPSLT